MDYCCRGGEREETEAMPIGIDMEAVEAQLASHEVRIYMNIIT